MPPGNKPCSVHVRDVVRRKLGAHSMHPSYNGYGPSSPPTSGLRHGENLEGQKGTKRKGQTGRLMVDACQCAVVGVPDSNSELCPWCSKRDTQMGGYVRVLTGGLARFMVTRSNLNGCECWHQTPPNLLWTPFYRGHSRRGCAQCARTSLLPSRCKPCNEGALLCASE
ncbi:hypothetical protein BC826DRAFT_71502 [Russula brevipes]|nr:hypothetical protein BC826DRAFT_71502 [Russula brevipes]